MSYFFFVHYTLFVYLFVISNTNDGKNSQIESNNCEHPLQDYKFGGGNMGWIANALTETKPVIFPCTFDSGGAKWVRFLVNKKQRPLDVDDEILLLMGSGMDCEEGSQINPNDIDANTILCDLKKVDITCPAENIRVSDTISDPFVQTVCVIAYCRNENLACNAEIQVEFYDQFAKPSDISRILLGCTWLDLFAWLLFFVMTFITLGIFYGLFGKYYPMFKEKRDKRIKKQLQQKQKKQPKQPKQPKQQKKKNNTKR